jgi:hypothetical protein
LAKGGGESPTVSYNDLDWKPNGPEPTCDISMNYGAFTNDSLTTMYEVVRGALDADDTLKERGEEIRFRVRETAEWKKHATDLEMEMIKRGMIFEVINWSQGQAELPK